MSDTSTRKRVTRGNRWFDLVIAHLSNLDAYTYIMEAYGPSWLTEQMVDHTWADSEVAAMMIAEKADL